MGVEGLIGKAGDTVPFSFSHTQFFESLLSLSLTPFTLPKSCISESKIITIASSFWRALATLELQVSEKLARMHQSCLASPRRGVFSCPHLFLVPMPCSHRKLSRPCGAVHLPMPSVKIFKTSEL